MLSSETKTTENDKVVLPSFFSGYSLVFPSLATAALALAGTFFGTLAAVFLLATTISTSTLFDASAFAAGLFGAGRARHTKP